MALDRELSATENNVNYQYSIVAFMMPAESNKQKNIGQNVG